MRGIVVLLIVLSILADLSHIFAHILPGCFDGCNCPSISQETLNDMGKIVRYENTTKRIRSVFTLRRSLNHYSDVTWALRRLKSPATQLLCYSSSGLTVKKAPQFHITDRLWGENRLPWKAFPCYDFIIICCCRKLTNGSTAVLSLVQNMISYLNHQFGSRCMSQ